MKSAITKILIAICLANLIVSQEPLISNFTSFAKVASGFNDFVTTNAKPVPSLNIQTNYTNSPTVDPNKNLTTSAATVAVLPGLAFTTATPIGLSIVSNLIDPKAVVATFTIAYTVIPQQLNPYISAKVNCNLTYASLTITRSYGAPETNYNATHTVTGVGAALVCKDSNSADTRFDTIYSDMQNNNKFIGNLSTGFENSLKSSLDAAAVISSDQSIDYTDVNTSAKVTIKVSRNKNPVLNKVSDSAAADGFVQHYDVQVFADKNKPVTEPSAPVAQGFTKFKITNGQSQVAIHKNLSMLLISTTLSGTKLLIPTPTTNKPYLTVDELSKDVPNILYLYSRPAVLTLDVTFGDVSFAAKDFKPKLTLTGRLATTIGTNPAESVAEFSFDLQIDQTSDTDTTIDAKSSNITIPMHKDDNSPVSSNLSLTSKLGMYSASAFTGKISKAISEYFQKNDFNLVQNLDIISKAIGPGYFNKISGDQDAGNNWLIVAGPAPKQLSFQEASSSSEPIPIELPSQGLEFLSS